MGKDLFMFYDLLVWGCVMVGGICFFIFDGNVGIVEVLCCEYGISCV